MAEPVVLIAWIDFLSPWSYVALTRLERLRNEAPSEVELQWKSFMGIPEKQQRDLAEFRASTAEWLEPASAEPSLVFSLWSTEAPPPTHSAPALAAHKAVEEIRPEAAADFRRATFRAYFSENRTISEYSVLLELATEVGVPADDFAMDLRGRYQDQLVKVISEHNEGARLRITEPPAVAVDGTYMVKGPATVEQYLEVIEKARSEREG